LRVPRFGRRAVARAVLGLNAASWHLRSLPLQPVVCADAVWV